MSWEPTLSLDAAQRAALEHAKPFVLEAPPAVWTLPPLLRQLPTMSSPLQLLILVPDAPDAIEAAALLTGGPWGVVHAATGLSRTKRLIGSRAIGVLAAAVPEAGELLRRSSLPADEAQIVVVFDPNRLSPADLDIVDSVLNELRHAQRIVVTPDAGGAADFIERHARRAPTAVMDAGPAPSDRSIRYHLLDSTQIPWGLRAALDAYDPRSLEVWDPGAGVPLPPDARPFDPDGTDQTGLIVATDLPSPSLLQAMAVRAEQVVLLLRPHQEAWLRSRVPTARPVRLSSEPDRARSRALALRHRLREILQDQSLHGEVLAIEPLLEEFDAVRVAAAALVDRATTPITGESTPAWTRVYVTAGRKQQLRPGDLVGALINAVGLRKDEIGKIEMRDSYSLVEIRPDDAARVCRGLTGQTIKGQRIAARLDQH